MSDNIVSVSDGTFDEEVLKSDVPVLVDYWAEWCGPCKMIAPILEEISGDYSGRLKIAKINIDENPGTPPKYGIRGIPTLMLFKNGSVEATKVGALSKSQLTAFIGPPAQGRRPLPGRDTVLRSRFTAARCLRQPVPPKSFRSNSGQATVFPFHAENDSVFPTKLHLAPKPLQ